jgi:hypothetical protein
VEEHNRYPLFLRYTLDGAQIILNLGDLMLNGIDISPELQTIMMKEFGV